MGAYILTLKSPKHNIKVNINGQIESVALLAFHYKPISTYWDREPRWQILAKARCQRMTNIWLNHGGLPKYACNVFVEDDGSIKFYDVFEWPKSDDASICDESNLYFQRKHIGNLDEKTNGVWQLKKVG